MVRRNGLKRAWRAMGIVVGIDMKSTCAPCQTALKVRVTAIVTIGKQVIDIPRNISLSTHLMHMPVLVCPCYIRIFFHYDNSALI